MLKYRSTDEISNYNIQRRSHIGLGWFSCGFNFSILVELEFRLYAFVKGRKPENRKKNPRNKARTNNKQTTNKQTNNKQTNKQTTNKQTTNKQTNNKKQTNKQQTNNKQTNNKQTTNKQTNKQQTTNKLNQHMTPGRVQWNLGIAKGLRIGKKCSLLQYAMLCYSVRYTEGYHMISRFRCIEVLFHTFYYYWGQENRLLYREVRYRGSLNRSSTVTTKSRFPAYCMLTFKNQEHFQSLKIAILP